MTWHSTPLAPREEHSTLTGQAPSQMPKTLRAERPLQPASQSATQCDSYAERGSGSGAVGSAAGDAGGGNQESAKGKGGAFGGDARAEAEDRVSADLIGGNVAFEEAGSYWPRTTTSSTNTSRFAASAHITRRLCPSPQPRVSILRSVAANDVWRRPAAVDD